MKTRTKILLCLAFVLSALTVYAWRFEPRQIKLTRLALPETLARALGPVRLVYLADLHVTRGWPKKNRLLALLDALNPDYLLLGGDLVQYQGELEPAIDLLKQIQGPQGTYAVLGDADYMGRVRNCAFCHLPGGRELRHDLPVRFLRNETVELADGAVRLVGLDADRRGAWRQTCRQLRNDQRPSIVLVHYPQALPAIAETGADLVLSADTHGGQINVPRRLATFMFGQARARYLYGWFQERGTPMFVTRGVGESILPIRFGCPPEIIVMEGGAP